MAKAFESTLAVAYRQLDEMETQGVDAQKIRTLRALALLREAGLASAVGRCLGSASEDIWYDRAIDLFRKSNDVIPNAETYLLMGQLHVLRHRQGEALAAFREAERQGTAYVKRGATEAIKRLADAKVKHEVTGAITQNRPWWRFW